MKEIRKFPDSNETLVWKARSVFRPLPTGDLPVALLFWDFPLVIALPCIVLSLFDFFFRSHLSGFETQLFRHFRNDLILVFGIPFFRTPSRKQTLPTVMDKRLIFQKIPTGCASDIADNEPLQLSDKIGYPSAHNPGEQSFFNQDKQQP
jgi:hypothetical protein